MSSKWQHTEREKLMLIFYFIETALQVAHTLKPDTGVFWNQYVDVPSCMEALIDIHDSLEQDIRNME